MSNQTLPEDVLALLADAREAAYTLETQTHPSAEDMAEGAQVRKRIDALLATPKPATPPVNTDRPFGDIAREIARRHGNDIGTERLEQDIVSVLAQVQRAAHEVAKEELRSKPATPNTTEAVDSIAESQLAEWERLAKEATPGPWVSQGLWVVPTPSGYSDADFIAAARTAVPALIAALRQAQTRFCGQCEAHLCADCRNAPEYRPCADCLPDGAVSQAATIARLARELEDARGAKPTTETTASEQEVALQVAAENACPLGGCVDCPHNDVSERRRVVFDTASALLSIVDDAIESIGNAEQPEWARLTDGASRLRAALRGEPSPANTDGVDPAEMVLEGWTRPDRCPDAPDGMHQSSLEGGLCDHCLRYPIERVPVSAGRASTPVSSVLEAMVTPSTTPQGSHEPAQPTEQPWTGAPPVSPSPTADRRAKGWVAFDLDGTLAEYTGWKGPQHIGAPVPGMVAILKAYLAAGREVRIFTARVDGGKAALGAGVAEGAQYADVAAIRAPIEAWCLEHIGRVLPITNVKDYGMDILFDDRAVRVVRNEGRPCCDDHKTDDNYGLPTTDARETAPPPVSPVTETPAPDAPLSMDDVDKLAPGGKVGDTSDSWDRCWMADPRAVFLRVSPTGRVWMWHRVPRDVSGDVEIKTPADLTREMAWLKGDPDAPCCDFVKASGDSVCWTCGATRDDHRRAHPHPFWSPEADDASCPGYRAAPRKQKLVDGGLGCALCPHGLCPSCDAGCPQCDAPSDSAPKADAVALAPPAPASVPDAPVSRAEFDAAFDARLREVLAKAYASRDVVGHSISFQAIENALEGRDGKA